MEPWQEPGADLGPWSGGMFPTAQQREEAAALMQVVPRVLTAPIEAAGKGVVAVADLPTTIHNRLNPQREPVTKLSEQSRPQIPKVEWEGKVSGPVAGVVNTAIGLANQMVPPMANPEVGLTLPLTGIPGAGKAASLGFGTSVALSLPEATQQAAEVLADPNAPTRAKVEAPLTAAAQAVFAKTMLGHATRAAQLKAQIIQQDAAILPNAAKAAAGGLIENEVKNASQTLQPVSETPPKERAEVLPQVPPGENAPVEKGPGVPSDQGPVSGVPEEIAPRGTIDPNADYEAAERAAIDQAAEANRQAGLPSEVVTGSTEAADNAPFARVGQNELATVDPQGRIVLNRPAVRQWLASMPAETRTGALQGLFAEEGIHSVARRLLADEELSGLWQSLTGPERALVEKSYFGKSRAEARPQYSDAQMGHEYLRREMQRLMKMDPREVAELKGQKGYFSEQVLSTIERVILAVRRLLGTQTSQRLDAMLNKLQTNVAAAKGEPPKGQAPGAYHKRVKVRTAEGELIDADFSGYWDLEQIGMGRPATIGYPDGQGGFTHGMLHPGDSIETQVPSFEEWKAMAAEQAKQKPMPEDQMPAAYRKKAKDTSEQGMMFLPPEAKGKPVERDVFPIPKASDIEATAREQFAHLGEKSPSFEDYLGALKAKFGGGITRDAAYYAYQDALGSHLMNAKGAELDALLDHLGLRKEVMESLNQQSLSRGSIPDAQQAKLTQAKFAEVEQAFKPTRWRQSASDRQKFSPAMRRRYAAIGAIMDKLGQEAGKAPERPWERTDVGPEDIAHEYAVTEPGSAGERLEETPFQIEQRRIFRAFTPDEIKDPGTVGNLATRNAAVDATGKAAPERTVSKNLTAFRDPDGRIILVSSWRDPRSGPKVTNLTAASLPGQKIDANLLSNYRPVAVMTLREPVKGFRKVFANQAAFDEYFGEAGIEGTPGIRTSSFAGPQAGITEQQAGIKGVGSPPPAEAGLPPALTEKPFVSETARELETKPRSPIQKGSAEYRMPKAQPIPGEKLPPAAAQAAEARAKEMHPYSPTPDKPEAYSVEYGKPTGKISEVGQPEPSQPGKTLRVNVPGKQDLRGRQAPAAYFKESRRKAQEEAARFIDSVGALVKRADTRNQIAAKRDAADNIANNLDRQAQINIRGATAKKGKSYGDQQVLAAANPLIQAGAIEPQFQMTPQVRAQLQTLIANDVDYRTAHNMLASVDPVIQRNGAALLRRIQGKATSQLISQGLIPTNNLTYTVDPTAKARLDDYLTQIANGEAKARQLQQTGNILERRTARKWLKAAGQLRNEVEYAKAHWDDPELQDTAIRMKAELDNQHHQELAAGYNIRYDQDYLPGRYDAELFNDGAITFATSLLGKNWRQPKTFASYYEAIEAGPYIAATRDGASIVGHRIRQGQRATQYKAWTEGLKRINDPDTNTPVAVEAVQNADGSYRSPSPEYTLFNFRSGYKPLAVRKGFEPLMRQLTNSSAVQDFAPTRLALEVGQRLKHTILLGDVFHLVRMGYYGASIMGKEMGHRRGLTLLEYRPANLPEAVRNGLVSPEEAAWATAQVPVRLGSRTVQMSRLDLAQEFQKQGLNVGKIQDAIYADLVHHIPVLGTYNKWLFDRFTRGEMMQAALVSFERLNKAHPNVDARALMKDVSRDVNNYFGSLGRQGVFKSATMQDLSRLVFLAPQWVEGLVMKDAGFLARTAGSPLRVVGYRKGLPQLGVMGEGIGRGLAAMLVLTQLTNLISRGKPTWQNEEEGHKFDAWIKNLDGEGGFWFSPLAVFNEMSHDLVRLSETKPKVWDAITQIGENKLSPWGRLGLVLAEGRTPGSAQKITTTAGILGAGAKQLGPVPISIGSAAQWGLNKASNGLVPPPPPGSMQRQGLASFAGIKVEPALSASQEVGRMAQRWMQENGKQKETGWTQVPTDEASYSKLRSALRSQNERAATAVFNQLRRSHTEAEIFKSMRQWLERPVAGSKKNEREFRYSLDDHGLELYSRAQAERQAQYEAFVQFYLQHAGQ